MTAPAFHDGGPVASAASNAGLVLTCPTGDPTGDLLVALVSSRAVGGAPKAPDGWAGPFGGSHLWAFTKIGVLADSGASVVFTAWTPEVITPLNVGVILAYSNAVAFDVVSSVALLSGGNYLYAPQVRTSLAHTAVVEVWSAVPPAPADRVAWVLPDTVRVAHDPPTGNDLWLTVCDQALASAGRSSYLSAIAVYSSQWRSLTFALRGNAAPTAPTNLSPPAGTYMDATAVNRFSWTFNDPDDGDSQSAFTVELDDTTAGTSAFFTGASDHFVDLPVGTFIAGHGYTWRVKTTDQHGATGPFSGGAWLTAVNPPAAPIISSPTDGSTVTAPLQGFSLQVVDAFDQVEWRRVADSAGAPDTSTVYADVSVDSVYVPPPPGSGELDYRSFTVTFDPTIRDEHVQFRYVSAGVYSAWSDVLVRVHFTPPPTPTVTISADDATGSLNLDYVVPAPTSGQPPATSVDLYLSTDGGATSIRVAKNQPVTITAPWPYRLPASGVDYWMRAVAYADDGATAASGWVDDVTGTGGGTGTGTGSGSGYGLGGYGEGSYGGVA